ncbi:uncharacterized protein BCR38DRAFT_461567 [Pseudomassariella vexata]|uniref:Cyclin-like protein n=1 Tax=Pseudomassariella vexata TaxID=1141098 RepID=A0A1Y2DBQ0_9PEZI|nr:uncharacterized protein BCR38DRAFT_461567 [Pseudomassariella vexata]ORY56574.1 hypothetical protein BCR38DRAFT_461567 [Pseudomassariella vexata]
MPGGVCAVLDYEVELMAEYVAEMAMRIVLPDHPLVTGAFRKFVSQVLTSTRLPSTTILLGMNYLSKRVNQLQAAPAPFKPNEGQVWRMLTVSLLLGSKFLDDNTFQNRSWSEVSGIPVQELNTMENGWLRDNDWRLYVNLDESGDYKAWLAHWKNWQSEKKREHLAQQQRSERLTPLVTSMRHHPRAYEGWTPEEITDHERARLSRNSKSYQYQNSWQAAPLTPPDSGYGTPDYLNSAASVNSRYNEWFNSAVAANYNRGYQSSNNFNDHRGSAHYQQPFYGQYGGQNSWESSVADCNCSQCMATLHKNPHYFHHQHHYGQPVMG